MPKQPARMKAQALEPIWYTATLTPQGTLNAQGVLVDAKGLQIGRPVKEVRARSKEEVEAVLKGEGLTWQRIEIVKGRDPGPWKHDRDRYAVELQTMLGRLHINAASPSEAQPMWVYGDPTYNEDVTARTMWAKFMDESSHGLSVSDFPRFIIPEVDGSRAFPLPPADVRNMERWDRITSAVHDHLDFWKSRLLERIERLDKIKGRSAEDAEQLERGRANLKALKRFDKWSYQDYAGQLLPDKQPHPLDLDNPRLYWLSSGKLIPTSSLMPDLLRVDFWRRLLELRDSSGDKWADVVRAFLDYHHRHGGKAEQFRDLVKVTAQRLRNMVSKGASPRDTDRWGLLADKLEGWLSTAESKRKAEIEGELSKPTRYVLMKPVGGPLEDAGWMPTNAMQRRYLEEGMGVMEPVDMTDKDRLSKFMAWEGRGNQVPLSVKPFGTSWDGGKPMDLRNPYSIVENWEGTGKTALIREDPDVQGWLMWQFREAVLMRWNGSLLHPELRSRLVRSMLEHHAINGGNEAAYLSVVEQQFLEQVPRASLAMTERIAKGEVKTTVPDAFRAEVSTWLAERRKPKAEVPTFNSLLGPANVEALRAAMNDAGIVYTAAKGKRKGLAALHAACDHWGKHPSRLMDWPPMLTDFFQGSRWSEKNTPRDQSDWDDTYRVAYHAIRDRLSA